jgi:hypothetical protein
MGETVGLVGQESADSWFSTNLSTASVDILADIRALLSFRVG